MSRAARQRRRRCTNKRRFHAEADARAEMAPSMNPYHCRFCGCWHIGHPQEWTGWKPGHGRRAKDAWFNFTDLDDGVEPVDVDRPLVERLQEHFRLQVD